MNSDHRLQINQAISKLEEMPPLGGDANHNVRLWLTDSRYAQFAAEVAEHVLQQRWSELERAFWKSIPFGTAGRRGRMYPIGCNAINERTVGETIQALADYVRSIESGDRLRSAVAYDPRHRSREFAELSAEILAAAGFTVWFLDGFRCTPELAMTVLHHACQCGVMITASHNPPTDNAVKVFWSSGGQLCAPHDKNVTAMLEAVTQINRMQFTQAVANGHVILCQDEMDDLYRRAVLDQGFPVDHAAKRNLKIVYSSLHGVGLTSVLPVLKSDGFANVEVFEPHAEPDGDFPRVPNHIANPENKEVFETIAQWAKEIGADLALASDPDADRIGCSAPLTLGKAKGDEAPCDEAPWKALSGNEIGALIGEYVLRRRRDAGTLSAENFVIKTVVTSDMLLHMADAFGVRGMGEVLTGFKWIGSKMDEEGAENFLFGFEEAHGYLVGDFIRDKDAGTAALILAQRAAQSKAEGRSLHQDLDALFEKYGCFTELTLSKTMTGPTGMARMSEIMQRLRAAPPKALANMEVQRVRDYQAGTDVFANGSTSACNVPQGNLLVFHLAATGFRAAVRPSGTEPKIKFYLFAFAPPESIQDLRKTKRRLRETLLLMHDDLMRAAGLAVEIA
jgi:phosphomannomutase